MTMPYKMLIQKGKYILTDEEYTYIYIYEYNVKRFWLSESFWSSIMPSYINGSFK